MSSAFVRRSFARRSADLRSAWPNRRAAGLEKPIKRLQDEYALVRGVEDAREYGRRGADRSVVPSPTGGQDVARRSATSGKRSRGGNSIVALSLHATRRVSLPLRSHLSPTAHPGSWRGETSKYCLAGYARGLSFRWTHPGHIQALTFEQTVVTEQLDRPSLGLDSRISPIDVDPTFTGRCQQVVMQRLAIDRCTSYASRPPLQRVLFLPLPPSRFDIVALCAVHENPRHFNRLPPQTSVRCR